MSEGRWVLPPGWKWAKAGEIAQIIGGGTPPANDESNFDEGGIPWITPADLSDYKETYIARGRRSLSDKGLLSSGAQLMPAGTVLFSSRAPIGYCAIATNPITTNQGFRSLILPKELVPEFVRYYLLASKEYAESLASGTTFKELSGSRLADMLVPVAPSNEQRRLVAHLDELFAHSKRAHDELNSVLPLVKRQKQLVLERAYSGELTREWREVQDISDPTLVRLSELCESIADGDHQAPPKENSGVPFITISAISEGKLQLSQATRFVSKVYIDSVKPSRRPQRGDVLFSVTGSIAIPVLVDTDDEFVFQRHIAILKPKAQATSGQFLALVLGAPQVREQAYSVATGTAQLTIPLSRLRELLVPKPSQLEQKEIIRRIESEFSRIDRIAVEASRAATLVNRLNQETLAKAFRGKLVRQEPNDEPASVLLERIHALDTIHVVENKERFSRKGTMAKITLESIKQIIRQLPDDKFSFEELRRNTPGDYESLREIVFALLDEAEPILLQTFDREAKAIRFVRRQA